MNEDNVKNSETFEDTVVENAETEEVVSEIQTEETVEEVPAEEASEENQDIELPSEVAVRKQEEEGVSESQVTEAEEIPEEVSEAADAAQSDFIDEFAPASIVIPNYNKEKELKKMEKASLKRKKSNTKKNIKRRRMIKKIVSIVCAVLLFVLLLVVSTATLSSVIVRVNTAEFAVEGAIRDYGPERIIIGKIENPEKLGMKQSADSASVADVLRDNATIPVTYAFIEQEVDRSTYPEFVSEVATDVIGYYVLGTPYKQVEEEEIANMLYKNSSKINAVTGRELTDKDREDFAKHITKSDVYKEISVPELEKQEAAKHTGLTSVLFSLPILVGLILAFMFTVVLVVMACKGYAHKIIGWVLVLAGAISGIAGFLAKPMYKASTEFVRCIVDAITASFHRNALIYGAVVVAVGLLVLLAGSAIKDTEDDDEEDEDEEYEEYEDEEYIEEIEQVSTAL